MYEDEEYEEVYEDDITNFISKMMLCTIFSRLPNTFTYHEFGRSFKKTFKGLEEDEIMNAFLMSLELELIENTSDETYCFNGIAIRTEDLN